MCGGGVVHDEDPVQTLHICIGYSFHIADSVEQGIKETTPFFEENIKMFAPLGFVPGLTPEQIERFSAQVMPGA